MKNEILLKNLKFKELKVYILLLNNRLISIQEKNNKHAETIDKIYDS